MLRRERGTCRHRPRVLKGISDALTGKFRPLHPVEIGTHRPVATLLQSHTHTKALRHSDMGWTRNICNGINDIFYFGVHIFLDGADKQGLVAFQLDFLGIGETHTQIHIITHGGMEKHTIIEHEGADHHIDAAS